MAKNKNQKLGNQNQNNALQTEFASESNVNNSVANKNAQKNQNQSNR